jgi:uncharacterized protein YndB with AHSA1/START domain
MPCTIVQTATFAAAPETLFDLYMDARKHTAATGGEAKITRKVGASFTAWDGYITGTNLAVVPKRLVVQSWRAADWEDADADSTFVLAFSGDAKKGRVDMVHAHVPDAAAEALVDGWHDNYWKPWRAYLRAQK